MLPNLGLLKGPSRDVPDVVLVAVVGGDGLVVLHAEALLALVTLWDGPKLGMWWMSITPAAQGVPMDVLRREFRDAGDVDRIDRSILHPELAGDGLQVPFDHGTARCIGVRLIDGRDDDPVPQDNGASCTYLRTALLPQRPMSCIVSRG